MSHCDVEIDGSNRDAILMEKYYKRVEEAFEILDSTFKVVLSVSFVTRTEHLFSEWWPNG